MNGESNDLSKKRFVISVDEIHQNFVFGAEFSGRYAKTMTLSDGTTRTIELTPMVRGGKPVIELRDTGGCTYMGIGGTHVNGKLMVQIHDLDAMPLESHRQPSSLLLERETSLITFPEFVPDGFTHGIEILNDNTTPMEFVTSILASYLGLNPEDSSRAMLQIHTRGGALFASPSLTEAQRIATEITSEAARLGYPLTCRPVSSLPADGT